jgi:hypothetical protein
MEKGTAHLGYHRWFVDRLIVKYVDNLTTPSLNGKRSLADPER